MRARLTAALYSCPSPLDINKDRRRTGQGGGGRKDRKRTCDRISDISFPERVLLRDTARSWRDQRERFCPNDRLRRKTTRGIILSLSIYLFRSSLKLNRDDIRDEFRDGVTVMPTLHHPPCYIVSDRFEYVYASIHCPVWVIACTRKNAWVTID